MRKILHASYLRAFTMTFLFNGPLLTPFATFVMYALLGNAVTPSKVFSVVAFFYTLRFCTAMYFPYAVMNGSEGLVSIRRIQVFSQDGYGYGNSYGNNSLKGKWSRQEHEVSML